MSTPTCSMRIWTDRLDAAILVAGHRSDLRLRSRGGGIRTHDLFVQNDPHLRVWEVTEVE